MDAIAFKHLVVSRFPALQDDFEEWRDFVHLQISEFLSFTQSATEAGSLDVVAQCFEVATAALREGDKDLRNAMFVSYLEPLDVRSDAGKRAAELMPLELRQGRIAVLDYDERLLGRKWPTDER